MQEGNTYHMFKLLFKLLYHKYVNPDLLIKMINTLIGCYLKLTLN